MKKLLASIVLVLYILSSQFVFKARATSDWDSFSQEEYCVSKKVDNFESKRSCRKKTHSAMTEVDIVQVPVLFSFFDLNTGGDFLQDAPYISSNSVLGDFHHHDPPDESIHHDVLDPSHLYVGVILLLL